MVEQVNFDFPVSPVFCHLQERYDGSGYPDGIAGDEIEMGARIISVANAFVGMVSPRAWRQALGFDEATGQLMGDSGEHYDPRPVAALINNRGGGEDWAHFCETPDREADGDGDGES